MLWGRHKRRQKIETKQMPLERNKEFILTNNISQGEAGTRDNP